MLNTEKLSAEPGLIVAAQQEIELLRRAYAKATDLLGTGTPAAIAEGTQIYHRIFTPDATLKTSGGSDEGFEASGPDEWVDVVVGALEKYAATQHLIGTQLVDIDQWDVDGSDALVQGHATMSSYLQAWHSTAAGKLWLFMGTYQDRVRYQASTGWQIYEMNLVELVSDHRQLGVEATA